MGLPDAVRFGSGALRLRDTDAAATSAATDTATATLDLLGGGDERGGDAEEDEDDVEEDWEKGRDDALDLEEVEARGPWPN